jgi:hypothetical protein
MSLPTTALSSTRARPSTIKCLEDVDCFRVFAILIIQEIKCLSDDRISTPFFVRH